MLIVIVIIVILAALLFPLVRNMRDKASSTGCASNMRQIAALSQLFAGDHNGQLPRLNLANKAATWGGLGLESISKDEKLVNNAAVYWWPDLLRSYNESPDVFSCPKLKSPAIAGPGGGPSDRYPLGIGINYSSMARNNANDTDQDLSWTHVINVPDLSRVAWFADAAGDYTGPWKDRPDEPGHGSCFFRGTNDSAQGVMPRHGGKVNVCFADGHVALVNPDVIDWGARDHTKSYIGYAKF